MGELNIPENEPGSSIMPGKVTNPVRGRHHGGRAVMGTTRPSALPPARKLPAECVSAVSAYNFLLSARLLGDVCDSPGPLRAGHHP